MNRRGFLGFLLSAPVVGTTVLKAVAAAPLLVQKPLLAASPALAEAIAEREAAKEILKAWLAETIDQLIFEELDR